MKIATYGFAEDQGRKLSRILQLSKTTTYQLVEFDPAHLPDLLLVFGEDQLGANEIVSLPRTYHSRMILVGKRRPQTQDYPFIGYPLVSSRVLNALDQLTCANEEMYTLGQTEAVESEQDELKQAATGADTTPSQGEVSSEAKPPIESESPAEITAIPAIEEEPKVTQAAQPEVDHINAPEFDSAVRTYRVLVVDDSHPMQQALAKELQTQFEQLHIDFADEGLMALEQVEQNTYDFIFLDIMMPGIDGFETCTRMRAMERLKKLPIIMLSSKTSPLDEVKGIMAGSSTYLTKPINPVEFQKVIARIRKWVDNFS